MYACEMAKRLQSEGVRFMYNTRVEDVVVNDSLAVRGVRLSTGAFIPADNIVIAAGNKANEFAEKYGEQVLSYPVKGYAIEVPISFGQKALCTNLVDDANKVYSSPLEPSSQFARPAIRLSGFAEFVGTQGLAVVRTERIQALLTTAAKFFPPGYLDPFSPDFKAHSCFRPQTPDDLPVIGASETVKGLWYNVGHGHLGWTRGAGSAKILADLMTGREPDIDPTPY
eukprot:Colp12_sorted_trinity150504_noHs@22447